MYKIFYKLDEEKQNRIINAGTNIFSVNDYKHASTDDIAIEAKIAKGSLFQYFKNKKSLFIFLYEYAMKIFEKKYMKSLILMRQIISKCFAKVLILQWIF